MSNENNMSAMDDSFREMEEETERLRLEQELEAQEAEFRIQQEAQEFDAYKQGLVEEFKNAANDGDSAPDASVEQNITNDQVEMTAPQVDEAEMKESQPSNEASEMLDNLTARAENILEGELNGAPLDMNDPAQMAMLESITEFVAAQQFTDVSPELLEAVQAKVQEQVIENANDTAEMAAAAPAVESPTEPQEAGVTITTDPNEITAMIIDDVAERMGGEDAGWDNNQVVEYLDQVNSGEIPEDSAIKEGFEEAVKASLDEHGSAMVASAELRGAMGGYKVGEEKLEDVAMKDFSARVEAYEPPAAEEVTPAVMEAPAVNSTANAMSI